MGAYIELVYGPFDDAQLQKDVEAIRAAGPASVVISSDLGQPDRPLHPDGLLALYKGLMKHGISEAEINQMAKTNPAKLLELQP
jgi:microsomal dipeptidase-like Zn-dependent dipeptidase